jgi:hypothetical protein
LQETRIQTELSLAFMNNGIPTATLCSGRFRHLSADRFCSRNTPLYLILLNTLEDKHSLIQVKYAADLNRAQYNSLVE